MKILIYSVIFFCQLHAQNKVFDIARYGSVEDLLLEVKNDSCCFKYVNDKGFTPLLIAVYKENYKVAEKLIELGSDVNFISDFGSVLMAAMYNSNDKIFNLLINSNVDINLQDKNGNTPLMFAVYIGNESYVKELLKRNANKNIINKESQTAFMIAVQLSNEKIIDLLINN